MQGSAGARKYAGEPYLRHLIEAAIETHPDIPIVMHQDHGASPSICIQSMRSGFSSVMMDGSLLEDASTPASYDYNVEVTRKVVDMAHAVGVTVEGELASDGSTWTARSLLEPATSYTLAMTGQNIFGKPLTVTSTFTTEKLSKKQEIVPTIIANGSTVGVAMPVVVRFSGSVTDRAAFERRMSVTSEPSQPGGWAWYSNTEAHWRPVKYWAPGTKVSVNLDVNGVNAGNGSYGQKSVTGGFTVGYSLIMKADLAAHQMTVVKDGQVIRTIPISGGRPGMETRSGTKVIIEKNASVIMDAATTGVPVGSPGYYRTDVKWAMRETWSGEYVHAAPWADASHGRANVSLSLIHI